MSIWEKEGESGLLDNFEFTITDAYWAQNEKYKSDDGTLPWILNWEGTTDSLDVPIMHVWYSPGGGWVSTDDGLTVHHDSENADKYFNKSTQYYKILARCRDEFQIVGELEKAGDPFTAATWVGFRFRMANENQPGFRGAEGKDKTMPVEYLGRVDGDSTNGSSTKSKTGSSETPQQKMARLKAEKAAKDAPAGDGELSLKDQVVAIIKENPDDFEAAQSLAMELEGFMDDDDLMQSMMDADGLFADTLKANA